MNDEISIAANEKWKIIADNWETLGPTAKPSVEEIELYRAVTMIELADKQNVRALIMGSTPELRDMCSEYFLSKMEKVYCVDATEDMYRAMSQLVKTPNPKEEFIHGNWLDLYKLIDDSSIDIVYGDHIVSNVGGKEKDLFDNIKLALKDNGCFVSKIQYTDFSDNEIKRTSAYEKLQKYARKLKEGQMDLKTAFTHFGLSLLFTSIYLNDRQEISFKFWGDELKELDENVEKSDNQSEKQILDRFNQVWLNWKDVTWAQYEKSKMHKIIEDNFYIKDEMQAPGHEFSRQTSIFRLKKG
jgi:SAM-dependent methyltransferase